MNSRSNLKSILNDIYFVILPGTSNIDSLDLLFLFWYDYFYEMHLQL